MLHGGSAKAAAAADARIMIVDDNRINLHLLTAILERNGLSRFEFAQDGREALTKLAKFDPDLILLDLMMPDLDGFEVCRRMRLDPRYAELPILVQSSLNRPEDRARAFAAGATDYVSKPINAAELMARIRIHLQNRFLIRRLRDYRHHTERELAMARQMQEQLMPQAAQLLSLEADLGIRVGAQFAPTSELGGDSWDLRRDGRGRLLVWLIDFSGHGVGAALNVFRLHAILKSIGLDDFDPAAFLETINRRLCTLLQTGQFATMLAGVVDPERDRFLYASAGSTRPMVWAPGATLPTLGDSRGLPAGIFSGASYENRSLPLPAGGSLFLYSDAAIELPVDDGVLDDEGLAGLVGECIDEPDCRTLLERVLGKLAKLGSFEDDLTAVVLQRLR
ncbi:MAG: SpoIIE family protein phosphatase [Azospirillum sp.]|nr:SpoIIE family protein phosphatase [Azospirillum sp.]